MSNSTAFTKNATFLVERQFWRLSRQWQCGDWSLFLPGSPSCFLLLAGSLLPDGRAREQVSSLLLPSTLPGAFVVFALSGAAIFGVLVTLDLSVSVGGVHPLLVISRIGPQPGTPDWCHADCFQQNRQRNVELGTRPCFLGQKDAMTSHTYRLSCGMKYAF